MYISSLLTIDMLYLFQVHHPIAPSLYYEDQKPEAKRRAEDFTTNRIPKFLTHFETVLQSNKTGVLVGSSVSTADLTLFQVIDGLTYAFPKRMNTLRTSNEYTSVFQLYEKIKGELKEYLNGKRRLEYSSGLYRNYAELVSYIRLSTPSCSEIWNCLCRTKNSQRLLQIFIPMMYNKYKESPRILQ